MNEIDNIKKYEKSILLKIIELEQKKEKIEKEIKRNHEILWWLENKKTELE